VTLPEDVVSEMRRRAWQPPALSDEDLMDVAARVRAG
jgi:hypothetical protein